MKLRKFWCRLLVVFIFVVSAGCWPASIPPESAAQSSGNTSSNASSLTTQTKDLSKKVNPTLAGIVFLLTSATYWILMRYTPDLSHEIALPPKLLEDNIAVILSKAWPEHYTDPWLGRLPHDGYNMPWVLFRKVPCAHKRSQESDLGPVHGCGYSMLRGFRYGAHPTTRALRPSEASAIRIRIFSPVMRSLVQAAVWNFVSSWLVVVMVTNTVVFNGFASNNLTNDSVLRLVLVGAYATANLLAQWHVSAQLYHNFTCTVFQKCWTYLSSDFVFLGYDEYRSFRMGREYNDEPNRPEMWATLDLELFGKTERSENYSLCTLPGRCRDENVGIGNLSGRSFLKIGPVHPESDFDAFNKPVRDAEIKAYEKTAEATLEKMLANVAALLGICLATALAPWTSVDKNDATASQLGSYALLLTISAGVLAIVGIFGQLRNATESARRLLKFQERAIDAAATGKEWANSPLDFKPLFSFSAGIENQLNVTATGLWRMASFEGKLGSILLGPALTLIPGVHRDCTDRAKTYFKVHGVDFALATDFEEPTDSCTRLSHPVPERESVNEETSVRPGMSNTG